MQAYKSQHDLLPSTTIKTFPNPAQHDRKHLKISKRYSETCAGFQKNKISHDNV